MILQALADYYRRKSAEDPAALAAPGFEYKEIAFFILLDRDGGFISLHDAREGSGRNKTVRLLRVPQAVKRSSGVAANLLWDNVGYVLGHDSKGKPERARAQHQAFVQRLRDRLGGDEAVQAVVKFLEAGDFSAVQADPLWEELSQSSDNLTFCLERLSDPVCERPAVREAVAAGDAGSGADSGICLLSGETDVISPLHAAIKGVWGAQSSGGNIVSFNLDAFTSFGKSQGFNAPVGRKAEFAYTAALNHLLRKESPQRMQVGDASTVWWAEAQTPLEDIFGNVFGDDPDTRPEAVRTLFEAPRSGVEPYADDDTRFYVLGLAPNAARIAVRFWYFDSVANLAGHIRRYFEELAIHRPAWAPPYPSLFQLLRAVAVQRKADNIPPNLGGEFMRAVLAGTRYPYTLLQAALRRNRAEQEVTWFRAALLKAWLMRNTGEKLTMALNLDNTSPGYRLGRLFAALERAQELAYSEEIQEGGKKRYENRLKTTIRDRYYGAASTTPITVFPRLVGLSNHHLNKLEYIGHKVDLEELIGEIMDGMDDMQGFPATLTLEEQARFALGYYQQRQTFYQGKNKKLALETDEEETGSAKGDNQ